MDALFTDETLMAFVDGELDELTAGRVARAAAAEPEIARRVETHRRLRQTLSARFDPILDEPVDARFRAMLGDNVVPLRAPPRRGFQFGWKAAAAVAATFAAGFLTAQAALGPPGLDGGAARAGGALQAALESQLASTQAADAPVRIGVTFAAADGRTCRSFEAEAMAGIACRSSGGWDLVAAAASGREPAGEYRQAGSGSAWVMQRAQELMAGDPLDAEAERRARDSDWRRNGSAR